MEYRVECSLENFGAWSGGKDTLDVLIEKGDCEAVEAFIEDCADPNAVLTDTEINDILWFERDDYDGLCEDGWSLEDLEQACDWWDGLGYDERSEISGISGADPDDDDAQFEEGQAIDEWWDDQPSKRKVELYYDNN